MPNTKILRKLARSNKYQNIYNQCKKIHGITLFKNKNNFTELQQEFLYWLSVYSMLYDDLYNNEKFINEEIIKNDIRVDAYLIYKEEKRKNPKKYKKLEESISTSKLTGIPTLKFE